MRAIRSRYISHKYVGKTSPRDMCPRDIWSSLIVWGPIWQGYDCPRGIMQGYIPGICGKCARGKKQVYVAQVCCKEMPQGYCQVSKCALPNAGLKTQRNTKPT